MKSNQLRQILEELKEELGIKDPIKIVLVPIKTKAASISLKRRIIRINKNIIHNLDEESIKYLILHELIHYKLKNTYHNGEFYKQLTQKINEERARELERKILGTLLRINHIL